MAPLEDLEQDYPIIDSNFRMFCASHGIFTGSFSRPVSNAQLIRILCWVILDLFV